MNAGADVNAVDSNDNPLLMNFINDKEIAPLLVQKGADIDIKLNDGSTILIGAVKARREDLVKLILQKKPRNLNAKNRDERTALYIATQDPSEPRDLSIISSLITAGADPFVVCKGYWGMNSTVFDISYGRAKEMLSAYKIHFEKTSGTTLIERGSHPLYHSTTTSAGGGFIEC